MTTTITPPPSWIPPGWREQVGSWMSASLSALGMPLTGEIEQLHMYPWSTVLSAPTTQGRVYFKASAPYLSNEAALLQALYRWRPDCMVQVLATDTGRRWALMADEGVRLRELMRAPEDLRRWEMLLPRFAEVQIEMIARRQELLDLGLVDHSLARLPARFARLLDDGDALRLNREDGLNSVQHARLQALEPRYAELCTRLEAFPIPESLHHDDFHDGNVFYRDGRYTFSDWGDSCLTHPFFSVIITLRSAADRLSLPDEATENPDHLPPELNRLRDAYLEPWTRFAPLPELRAIFPTAWRAGMVNRALGWYLEIANMDPPAREQYGYTIPAWLGEFLLAMGER